METETKSKPAVGQRVFIGPEYPNLDKPEPLTFGTVRSVGRKYFTVLPDLQRGQVRTGPEEWYCAEMKLEDWKCSDKSNFNYVAAFTSEEEYLASIQATKDDMEHRRLQNDLEGRYFHSLTLDQLRRIQAIIAEPNPTPPSPPAL